MRLRLPIFLTVMAAALGTPAFGAQPGLAPGLTKLVALQISDIASDAPPSPTLLPATNVTVSGFTVNWTPADGAINYFVEVAGSADFSQVLWSGSTYYSDEYNINVTGNFINPSSTYYFRVSSNGNYNNQDQSAPSAVANVTTDPFPAPLVNAATNITVTGFTANWIPVPEASGYSIDISTTPDFGNLVLGNYYLGSGNFTNDVVSSDVSAPYWDSDAIQPGTTYYYRIYANRDSTSSLSSMSQTVTTATLGAPVVTSTSKITINSFATTWTPVGEATGYYIDVSTTPDFGNLVVTNEYLGDATLTSATVNLQYNIWYEQGPNLPSGGTFYYRIRANDYGVTSPNSNTQSFSTPVYAAPVVNAATHVASNGFTMTWNAVPGATGYALWLSTTPDSSGVFISYGTGGDQTSLTVTPPSNVWDPVNVLPGTTYYYWVVATDGIINSLSSNVQSVTTTPLATPQLNNPTNITPTSFTLNWNAVPGATGYDVYIYDYRGDGVIPHISNGNTTSINVTYSFSPSTGALDPGATYSCWVRADSASGVSANSITQNVTTATLPIPLANNATNIGPTSFTANWAAVPYATGYYVDVSTRPDFADMFVDNADNSVSNGNATSLSISGYEYVLPGYILQSASLQPNTTYYYRVRSSIGGYISDPSATETFTTAAFPAPQVSAATNITINSFTAHWTPVAGATGYTIDISTVPDFSSAWYLGSNVGDGNTTSATWTSLRPATTFYYRIHATGPNNIVSPPSTVLSFTTASVSPPVLNEPIFITINGFGADWTPVPGATGYVIDVSTTPDFGNLVINDQTTFNSNYQPVGGWMIQPNTTYYYRVRAVEHGELGNSNTQTVTTDPFPAPQIGVATNITYASFTANWQPVDQAIGYSIDVSTTPDFAHLVINSQNVNGGGITSGSVSTPISASTPLEPGTTYYYRVRANGPNVSSANSATQTFTTIPFPAPQVDAATNITIDTFNANWEPVAGAVKYLLDVSTTPDFGNLVLTGSQLGNGSVTNATVGLAFNGQSNWRPTFQPNTTYYYRIYAQTANFTTPYSAAQTVTTAVFPAPQLNAASNITYYSFDANWGTVPGAANYLIDVSTTPDFGNLVLSGIYLEGDGNSTSATVEFDYKESSNWPEWWLHYLLQPNTTYYYRIYAQEGSLTSADSNTQSVTTAGFTAPAVDAASNITPGGFTVNWETVPGATGYSIDVSTTPDFGNLVSSNFNLGDGNTTSANIAAGSYISYYSGFWTVAIQPNTTYYYRICAQANNLNSLASLTQNVTTMALPAPVVTAATNVGFDGFTANWNPVPNATGYSLDLSLTPDFGNLVLSNYNLGDGSTTSVAVNTPPAPPNYGGGGIGWYGGGGGVITIGGGFDSFGFGGGGIFNLSNNGGNLQVITSDLVGGSSGATQSSGGATVDISVPTTIQPNTTYYYRIRANWDNSIFSANSAPQTVTTADFPAPPSSAATNITYTSFSTSWSMVSDAASYSMDISTTPDFGNMVDSGVNLGDGNTTSVDTSNLNLGAYYYTPLTLQAGTTYYYRIYAVGANTTTSDFSKTQSLTTLSFPTPIVYATTNITTNDFTINWETVPDATGYSVDVSTSPDFSAQSTTLYFDGGDSQNGEIAPGYWYNLGINLQPNTTYYYRVYADGPNYSSQPSTTQNVTTAAFTPPTGESVVDVTDDGFTANWSAIPGASNYLLTVSLTPDFSNVVFTASVGNTTSYTLANLQAGTNYYYQISAYNSVMGYSGHSTAATAATVSIAPGQSGYADWTKEMKLAGANALPAAAPFKDGLPNLMRYAMNLGLSPSRDELPSVASTNLSGTKFLTLQYRQRKSLSDYRMVAQYSTDLIHWTAVPPANITQLADDDADTMRYEACTAVPSGGSAYLRVIAVPTPSN